jgi:hypothetical protein
MEMEAHEKNHSSWLNTMRDLTRAKLLLSKEADANVWCSEQPVGTYHVFYHYMLFGPLGLNMTEMRTAKALMNRMVGNT